MMLCTLALAGCKEEHEPFDPAYIYFLLDNGTAETVVTSDVKAVNTYYIYLSSRALASPLTVTYEVTAGDGLTEGVDYELLTSERELTFMPGVFDMPIRVRWMPHPVDPSRDNTLTFRLTGNNQGLPMGFPGPDAKMSTLRITKK